MFKHPGILTLHLGDAPSRLLLTLLSRDKHNIAPLAPPIIELDHGDCVELYVEPDGRSALIRPVGLGECILRVTEAAPDARETNPQRQAHIAALEAKVNSGTLTRAQYNDQLGIWDNQNRFGREHRED